MNLLPVPPSPDTPERLFAQQIAFAAHLRDPDRAPAPEGIEDRRLGIYRELFFNNVEGLLSGNFPVIRDLLGKEHWQQLARDFYREHQSHTPLFPEIGREFLRYLQTRAERGEGDPPFLPELAHYEWVELALTLDENELAGISSDPDGDLLDGIPVPSPLAWPLAYTWPVQQLRRDFQPGKPPEHPTFLLVLRDRKDTVRFKTIDALTFLLMQALHDNQSGLSGRELLHQLAHAHQAADIDAFVAGGARALAYLRQSDAVLGTRP